MIISAITKFLKIPLVRHLLAGLVIVFIVSNIKNKEIKRIDEDRDYLIEVMAEQLKVPKYSILNQIENTRRKATVTLIPDNEITHVGDNETEPKIEPEKEYSKFGKFLRRVF